MHASPDHLRTFHRRRKFHARVLARIERDDHGILSWLGIGLLWLGVALLAGVGNGCKSGRSSQNIALTGGLIGQADVLVEAAIPHTDSTGKPMLNTAREKLAGASESNAKANVEFAELDAKYTRLDSKWYVRWGRRIEGALWLIGLAWGASELLGMGLMIFTGGASAALGHHILALLPFSNFFLTAAVRTKNRLTPRGGTGVVA